MKTYQDLVKCGEDEKLRTAFVYSVIKEHKGSEQYKIAQDGERYARQQNTTITEYQKLLYTVRGDAVPDNFTANHKCASNFFDRFITQENQYLLGNGVKFENDDTKDRIGGSDFDTQLQKLGKFALWGGVSFGLFDVNKIRPFSILEFAPLYDEEDGSLKAGVRFWQISPEKPLRCTLYELDGYTDYIRREAEEIKVLNEKKPYIVNEAKTEADGVIYTEGQNYPTFPIVPLYANTYRQSELVGIKSQIDAYDLIKSGFANDLDDCSMIYWTLENCGGMDDIDLTKFVERMKIVKAAVVDGDAGARAEAHTIDIPYQSRETYLNRLENDLYNDYMALNVNLISAGNITATQIQAAYEPLNNKADQYEYCVIEFIKGILELAGIEDNPTFTRSKISNIQEETQVVLSAGTVLSPETIIRHLPFLTPEEQDEAVDLLANEDLGRFTVQEEAKEETEEAEQPDNEEDEVV